MTLRSGKISISSQLLDNVWPLRGDMPSCRCYNSDFFGIVWVHNKLINTPSMILSPSTILLQPHVWLFLASQVRKNLDFLPTIRQVWPSSGSIAACRGYNSRCLALSGSVSRWLIPPHVYKSINHTFTAICWRVSCIRLSCQAPTVDCLQSKKEVTILA